MRVKWWSNNQQGYLLPRPRRWYGLCVWPLFNEYAQQSRTRSSMELVWWMCDLIVAFTQTPTRNDAPYERTRSSKQGFIHRYGVLSCQHAPRYQVDPQSSSLAQRPTKLGISQLVILLTIYLQILVATGKESPRPQQQEERPFKLPFTSKQQCINLDLPANEENRNPTAGEQHALIPL